MITKENMEWWAYCNRVGAQNMANSPNHPGNNPLFAAQMQNAYLQQLQVLDPMRHYNLVTPTNQEKNMAHWEEMTELLLTLPHPIIEYAPKEKVKHRWPWTR